MFTFNEDQMSQYFDHINLPREKRKSPINLEFLTELVRRQLATVPFESLALHYSKHHLLSLEPDDLFEKVVTRNMGGYCMENNTFFGVVLRSLGFKLISTGARVNIPTRGRPGGDYNGWSHMVNLVTLNGQKFLVDVGFGPDAPCRPVPLKSGQEFPGIMPQRLKLEYKALPKHTDQEQRVWVYSSKKLPEDEWLEEYAFSEIEFFPEDFEVMNLSTMTSRGSFFTQTILCVKSVLDEKEEEAVGLVTLFKDEVKKRIKGEVVETEKFATESERIKGLEKWFGIQLNEEEQKGIRHLPTELAS